MGATASAQAALVTADSSTTLLNATVGADAATVRSFVGLNLLQEDLQPGGLSTDRQATLQLGLHLLVDRGGILRAALLAPDGTVLSSDDGTSVGQQATLTPGLTSAIGSQQADAAIVPGDAAGALAPLATDSVLREYLPIIENGRVYAVVAVWRDAAPILAQLDQGRLHVVVITLSAALVSALLLAFIFRAAQQRLTRQTVQLLEAARRDPLTGALNHGALVETLAAQVEAARAGGEAIGVALFDLDNFGLLDDTYGHPAGDHVLVEVVRLLGEGMPPARPGAATDRMSSWSSPRRGTRPRSSRPSSDCGPRWLPWRSSLTARSGSRSPSAPASASTPRTASPSRPCYR